MDDFNLSKTPSGLKSNSNVAPETDYSSRLVKSTSFQKDLISSVTDANCFFHSKTMSDLPILTTKENIGIVQLPHSFSPEANIQRNLQSRIKFHSTSSLKANKESISSKDESIQVSKMIHYLKNEIEKFNNFNEESDSETEFDEDSDDSAVILPPEKERETVQKKPLSNITDSIVLNNNLAETIISNSIIHRVHSSIQSKVRDFLQIEKQKKLQSDEKFKKKIEENLKDKKVFELFPKGKTSGISDLNINELRLSGKFTKENDSNMPKNLKSQRLFSDSSIKGFGLNPLNNFRKGKTMNGGVGAGFLSFKQYNASKLGKKKKNTNICYIDHLKITFSKTLDSKYPQKEINSKSKKRKPKPALGKKQSKKVTRKELVPVLEKISTSFLGDYTFNTQDTIDSISRQSRSTFKHTRLSDYQSCYSVQETLDYADSFYSTSSSKKRSDSQMSQQYHNTLSHSRKSNSSIQSPLFNISYIDNSSDLLTKRSWSTPPRIESDKEKFSIVKRKLKDYCETYLDDIRKRVFDRPTSSNGKRNRAIDFLNLKKALTNAAKFPQLQFMAMADVSKLSESAKVAYEIARYTSRLDLDRILKKKLFNKHYEKEYVSLSDSKYATRIDILRRRSKSADGITRRSPILQHLHCQSRSTEPSYF